MRNLNIPKVLSITRITRISKMMVNKIKGCLICLVQFKRYIVVDRKSFKSCFYWVMWAVNACRGVSNLQGLYEKLLVFRELLLLYILQWVRFVAKKLHRISYRLRDQDDILLYLALL